MTKFNPHNKTDLTYGDCLFPAMDITDKQDADQYVNDYALYIQKENEITIEQALDNARFNIIYWSGYYDDATINRIKELFDIQLVNRKLPWYFFNPA